MPTIEIRVPDIGDFQDVAVIELLAKPGEHIQQDQSLVTVESDKASMEIPASHAGVLRELKVRLGDKINQGDVLAVVETEAASAAAAVLPPLPLAGEGRGEGNAAAGTFTPSPQPSPASGRGSHISTAAEASAPPPAPPADLAPPPSATLPLASPSVRKFARELGVPLGEVTGSGYKGRITIEDVQAFSRAVMDGSRSTQAQAAKAPAAAPAHTGGGLNLLPWPQVDFAKFGGIATQNLSRIKKISAANLSRNWVMIPHVTYCEDADITELEALRVQLNGEKAQQQAGVKVTMLSFLIKACVQALKTFPDFNASLDGDALVRKQYYHIGFAADTPNGLMVPVIKDADQKGVLAITQDLADLSQKARSGKLSPSEMQGATFTISSLGGIGGTYFSPIINAPEVAILGVCRSDMRPRWNGTAFEPRLMLPLSLSADHRVIDGAAAARFNAYLAQVLADFRRVVL